MGRHKTNRVIPLRVTMVQAKVHGKPVIVHYIDDISGIRKMEDEAIVQMRAFDFEKNKMQNCKFFKLLFIIYGYILYYFGINVII